MANVDRNYCIHCNETYGAGAENKKLKQEIKVLKAKLDCQNKNKNELPKRIYIRWLDSATSSGWQKAPNKKTGLTEIVSVGYLIFEYEKQIQIAQSIFAECNQKDGILAIPKSVIKERKRI